MSFLTEIQIDFTTNGSGAVTADATQAVLGLLYAVRWIDGTLSDGVDAVISTTGHDASATLLTLTNANNDATYYPRDLEDDLTGTDATNRVLPLIVGVPRVAVTSGGATKTGGVILYVIED